jgi:uncharacterized protein (DUF4213/DUF364 family)
VESLDRILASLRDGRVSGVYVGLFWTAVVAEVQGRECCGLASTVNEQSGHHGELPLPEAGRLGQYAALELASWCKSPLALRRSIGLAAVNALLPEPPLPWVDANAEVVLVERGRGKKVALVGHFPFVEQLRASAASLWVLEQNPLPGDLPAERAPEVIPQADIVAITGMAVVNNSLPELLAQCRPGAWVMLVGPSAPLSPVWYDYGVHWISGARVRQPGSVVTAVMQGASFRQIHKAGVQLITMAVNEDLSPNQS